MSHYFPFSPMWFLRNLGKENSKGPFPFKRKAGTIMKIGHVTDQQVCKRNSFLSRLCFHRVSFFFQLEGRISQTIKNAQSSLGDFCFPLFKLFFPLKLLLAGMVLEYIWVSRVSGYLLLACGCCCFDSIIMVVTEWNWDNNIRWISTVLGWGKCLSKRDASN